MTGLLSMHKLLNICVMRLADNVPGEGLKDWIAGFQSAQVDHGLKKDPQYLCSQRILHLDCWPQHPCYKSYHHH